ELAARLGEEAYRPFDLARGPLLRISLLRAGRSRILLVAAHHVITDLWSLSVALRDLQALYAAELGLGPAVTAPPPHPAEFVRWQASRLASNIGERQFDFWRGQLAGDLPALDLPVDRPRPPGQTFRGGVRTFDLEPALADAVRARARAQDVTLYTLLLAAYQAFLGRISGQPVVRVGSPASGRTAAQFAGLVAYLVNPVVLRADLAQDPS